MQCSQIVARFTVLNFNVVTHAQNNKNLKLEHSSNSYVLLFKQNKIENYVQQHSEVLTVHIEIK